MFRQPSSSPGRGFTLVEVMVSLVFLTIAIFGLVSANIYAARAHQVSKERQAANVLAVSQLESCERLLRHDFNESVELVRHSFPSNPDFEREVLVSSVGTRTDLKRVDVNIYWNDKNGAQNENLWTYFYDRSR